MAEREAGPVLVTRPEPGERIDLMRTRDITDIKVQNPEGENLGDLTDIAIDRDSGCIMYAVLAYGGILGFGEKHFAIPWEAVRIRSREKVAVVDTDKRTLDGAPGFPRDRMPGEGDWSLIRTPPRPAAERERPPSREEKPAAPTESAPRGEESYVPVPPPVQTVAGGWGGQPTKQRTEERPETRRREPSPARISAADLQVSLKGIDYLVGRQDLVAHARKNNAPENVIAVIEGFGDRTYRSAADVSAEFGRETRGEKVREEPARPVTEAEQSLTTPGPAPGHVSAADLQVSLKGMNYPAGRQDLVAHARKNNAPENVIAVLEGFGDRTYRSAAEVSEEFGRETRGEEVRREQPTRVETAVEERPETRRSEPSPARISAANLQVYLKGMDYPAGRQDLVTHARKNNAPEDVIAVIERFGDRTYRSAADVSEEFGKVG